MDDKENFVGIQISPISFIDEGTEQVLDTLQARIGINALLLAPSLGSDSKLADESLTNWRDGRTTVCRNLFR